MLQKIVQVKGEAGAGTRSGEGKGGAETERKFASLSLAIWTPLISHFKTRSSAVTEKPRDASYILLSHSRSFDVTPFSRACVSLLISHCNCVSFTVPEALNIE